MNTRPGEIGCPTFNGRQRSQTLKGNVFNCHFSNATSSQTSKGDFLKCHFYPAQVKNTKKRDGVNFISSKVFSKSFFESQFPHKSVDLFFTLVSTLSVK